MTFLRQAAAAARVFGMGTLTAAALTCAGTAPAADALPSVLFLVGVNAGELKGSSTAGISLFHGVQSLEAAGYVVSLEINANGASLGPAHILIKSARLTGTTKKCGTAVASSGEISFAPEWHVVLPWEGGAANLFLTLFLVPEVKVKCEGGSTIKIKGSFLMESEPFARFVLEGTAEIFEMDSPCEPFHVNAPLYKKYRDAANNEKQAKLESSIGLGFEESCLDTFFEVKPTKTMQVMEP